MKKTIITVLGKDRVGIMAKVCVYLSQNNINILDIAQTIVDGYFNMMMVADTASASKDHDRIAEELADIGDELGVQIKAQQEEIFDMMHRL
jgi:ACT domain-containing protein